MSTHSGTLPGNGCHREGTACRGLVGLRRGKPHWQKYSSGKQGDIQKRHLGDFLLTQSTLTNRDIVMRNKYKLYITIAILHEGKKTGSLETEFEPRDSLGIFLCSRPPPSGKPGSNAHKQTVLTSWVDQNIFAEAQVLSSPALGCRLQ